MSVPRFTNLFSTLIQTTSSSQRRATASSQTLETERLQMGTVTTTNDPNQPTTLIHVGGEFSPRRDMIGWGDMEPDGWMHRFSFRVFRDNIPGTVPITIGEAFSPHRVTVVMRPDVDGNGWRKRLHFYAWEHKQPGTVMIAIAEAQGPWRCKFVLGRHIGEVPAEDRGWVEKFSFWAYRAV